MTFNCPRCGTDVSERFYGPCTTCRGALGQIKPPARDRRFVRIGPENGYHDTIVFDSGDEG